MIDDGFQNGLLYVDYANLHGSSISKISIPSRKSVPHLSIFRYAICTHLSINFFFLINFYVVISPSQLSDTISKQIGKQKRLFRTIVTQFELFAISNNRQLIKVEANKKDLKKYQIKKHTIYNCVNFNRREQSFLIRKASQSVEVLLRVGFNLYVNQYGKLFRWLLSLVKHSYQAVWKLFTHILHLMVSDFHLSLA